MPERILAFKLGGYGDVVDFGVMLGGIRKKHPNAVITAVVRDSSQIPFLRAIQVRETSQSVVDVALPVARQTLRYKHCWKCQILVYDNDEYTGRCHVCGRKLRDYWHTRNEPLDWLGALKHEINDTSYDYVYEWRPYLGWVTSTDAGDRKVEYICAKEIGAYWKAFPRFLSRDTNRLAQLGMTTVELGNMSMQLEASWDGVQLDTPTLTRKRRHQLKKTQLEAGGCPYVVLTNASDGTGKQTKQWSQARMGDVAQHLDERGYVPVQLGVERDKPIPNCLDFRGKTSMLEAAAIIRDAALVVGIEGGLARVAALVGTPSVVIFLSTPRELFEVPLSTPVFAGACPLKHGCFWWTAEWMTSCAKNSLIKIESGEVLPRCAAFTTTSMVIEKVEEALCAS